MAKEENSKTVEERVAALEAEIKKLKKRGGGMLSSSDFRKRVIFKRNAEDESWRKIEGLFRKRDWENAKKEIRTYKGETTVEPRKCFIINPFDLLNLTPFSYDLSIGRDIVSVREKKRIRYPVPYNMAPRETVVVLTEEFIALPPCYSATVWPRFNLVREGVFQSMVKIDPTWYGKLGVAMTNLSPRTITLEEGMSFATLILYELANDTDINLWEPENLECVRVAIPTIPIRDKLQDKLEELELTTNCWVENGKLVVRALKKEHFEKLCELDHSQPWQKTVREAKEKWLDFKDSRGWRSIGMGALGMENLMKLTGTSSIGESVDPEKVKSIDVSKEVLYRIAVENGKPFDLIANIPSFILEKVEKEIVPRLEAEVGARLYPQIIQLTLRVLALLSLVGVAVALAAKYFDVKQTWLGVVAVLAISVMLVVLVCIFGKFPQVKGESEGKVHSEKSSVSVENIEIEKEYRFPRLAKLVFGVLSRLKKK